MTDTPFKEFPQENPPAQDSIHVRVNEREYRAPAGMTLFELRDSEKPDADVVILNGFPLAADQILEEGDEVVLIRRGEIPTAAEMQALLMSRHGPGVHEKVRQGRVGIAGCGGLGSALAIALARTGVGELVLVDFDVVEPSNLNRQQYFVDQIGQPKVRALAENLARINPYVKVTALEKRLTRDSIVETFAGCHVVAECFDAADMKRDMLLAVRAAQDAPPLVTVSGIAGYGPSDEICCKRVFEKVWLVGDGKSAAQPGRGLLAPRVAVASGHQANVVLRLLLGEETTDGKGES